MGKGYLHVVRCKQVQKKVAGNTTGYHADTYGETYFQQEGLSGKNAVLPANGLGVEGLRHLLETCKALLLHKEPYAHGVGRNPGLLPDLLWFLGEFGSIRNDNPIFQGE